MGETLLEVISCLVEKTGGVLKPLILEQAYEESISKELLVTYNNTNNIYFLI